MAGVLSGLLFLLILVIGFYWDVAWHIDNGRDTQLFTPSHTMILVGLGGLVYAAFLTMGFATLDKARVGFKYGVANVPWSSVLLLCLGFGGMAAFPLDNLWHETYGIDVTLWSPTHLQLVGGGALGTVALFLMLAEALPFARPTAVGRAIFVLTGGTVLVALSAVQAEFDYGVPQFQALYLPLLIMVAAGIGLVLARIALGPWGAVKVVCVYLGLRVFLALVVGGVFHHTVPRFPLYLASALAVEGAAALVGTRSRLRFGLAAGGLVGTVGLVGELAWVRLSGWAPVPMPPSMAVKVFLLGPVAAVAAALLGAGLGRAFVGDVAAVACGGGWVGGVGAVAGGGGGGGERMPVAALVGAGVALVAVLAYPLPRNVGSVDAVVRTEVVAGDRAFVEVTLDPPDAADDASGFAVTSWQGGGRVTAFFDEVEPGRYRSEKSVPVTGELEDGGEPAAGLRGDGGAGVPARRPVDRGGGGPPGPRAQRPVRAQHHPVAAGAAPRPAVAGGGRVGRLRDRPGRVGRPHGGDRRAGAGRPRGRVRALPAGSVGRPTGRPWVSGDHWLPTAASLVTPFPRSCGAAWSARRPVKAEVASSNLVRTAPHGRVAQ